MKQNFYIIAIIIINLLFITNNSSNTSFIKSSDKSKETCTECKVEKSILLKQIKDLEDLTRHYRDEIAKWMKMYYEAKEGCFDTVAKWVNIATGLGEKIINHSIKVAKM